MTVLIIATMRHLTRCILLVLALTCVAAQFTLAQTTDDSSTGTVITDSSTGIPQTDSSTGTSDTNASTGVEPAVVDSSTGSSSPPPSGSTPQPVYVAFALRYSIDSLPGGSSDAFGESVLGDISVALGCDKNRMVYISLVDSQTNGAPSVYMTIEFVADPSGSSTATPPSTLASLFIAKVNDINSSLYSQSTTKKSIPNTAFVIDAPSGENSEPGGLKKLIGGLPAYGLLIILIIACLLIGLIACYCMGICKRKKLTMDQRMMGRNTGEKNTVESDFAHMELGEKNKSKSPTSKSPTSPSASSASRYKSRV